MQTPSLKNVAARSSVISRRSKGARKRVCVALIGETQKQSLLGWLLQKMCQSSRGEEHEQRYT